MPTIKNWLTEMGLEKYVAVFEAAEIDFDTLPELFEDDLKELDLPLGPRRKIWSAIARMAAPLKSNPTHANAKPVNIGAPPAAHAERRHLTVMFVDLVGSTEMVMRMDAEDMREIITKYQHAVAEVVDAYKGFVATLLGDGMLCYFGWPHADEGDTERAVRAGLSIIEATKKIIAPDGNALASRVGVASGVVVVGDLIGGGARQEAAVVGETPNLAARLQGVAEPNQLVVPGDVLPLLGATFELSSLGAQKLKGVNRSVEAFVVKGETTVESRFAARRTGSLTPIVGRASEIDKIMDCWSFAQSGHGQAIVLTGEAGIGKSRIIQAVSDAVKADDHIRVTYQCSPYHTDSAFYPFIRQLNQAAGFTTDDTNDGRLTKIETMVNGDLKSSAMIALLLGIDGTARYGEIDDTPNRQRANLIQTIVALLSGKARDAPLLLIVEDLHWIDPTSLELLECLLEALPNQKIMLLASTRPSDNHSFGAHQPVTQLALNRLSKNMTYAIVAKLTGGKVLPDEIMQIIASRTDGVPLFVEELTKTLLESGALKEDETSYQVNGSLSDIAIPATLHDSLTARLDRMNPIKEIAQIAACIGREFSHRLMTQICEISATELEDSLAQLIAAELIYQSGPPAQSRYQFKHALVRDAAYESLLKTRRTVFHKRILTALETEPDSAPELLAAHAEAAQLTDRAIELWGVAGKAAISRPAYKESEAHVRRAIALNKPKVALGDKTALSKALSLQVQLYVALTPDQGLWADETVATLEEALMLADKVGDTPLRGDIICGLLLSTYFRGNLELSIARADELNILATASNDLAQLLVAKRLTAIGRLKMGWHTEAQPLLDEAEELCDRVADQNLAARFGYDPVAAVKTYQSLNAMFHGKTIRAKNYQLEAEDRARKVAHTNTTCAMLGMAVTCAHVANDIAAERRHLQILRPLIEEHSVSSSRMWAEATFALLQMAEGDPGGLVAYRKAETAMINAKIRLLVPGNRIVAARRAMALGLMDDALEMTLAAETMMNETGEKSWLPDIFRLHATFALKQGNHVEAERNLKIAINLSQENGGTLWELRAAIDLATLYQNLGRFEEAAATIDPVFHKIEPGDCPQEIETAKGLVLALNAVV